MKTQDPFLFAVYHKDMYPAGDDKCQAPRRGNGADFDPSAPYRMYHGDRVPGFPHHPHRGFETITYVTEGTVDHTDSLGSAGRYSDGDMQFMTAGAGCVHGEMFPLLHKDKPNTLRLFQIWLNLPRASKMADPGYLMYWAENMVKVSGEGGAIATVVVGSLGTHKSFGAQPKASWSADPSHDVGVFTISLPPGSKFTLPAALGGADVTRSVHVIEAPSTGVTVGGKALPGPVSLEVRAEADLEIAVAHGSSGAEVLVLQGKPIGEPVAQRGPFVMNTEAEIAQAYRDYQRTQFGGWPWEEEAPIFPRSEGRFAKYVTTGPDGKKVTTIERPPAASATSGAGGASTAATTDAGVAGASDSTPSSTAAAVGGGGSAAAPQATGDASATAGKTEL